MMDTQPPDGSIGRRHFFVRAILAVHATIGSTLAFVVGSTTLAPSFTRRDAVWLQAAELETLAENQPVPVTLRVMRQDGHSQIVDRTVVYLVRTGETEVHAMQSTCTHLGCRTAYDPQSNRIKCPCHGGVYDAQGTVVDGPPPGPLPRLTTRVIDGRVQVRV